MLHFERFLQETIVKTEANKAANFTFCHTSDVLTNKTKESLGVF
jgi:hypothetical protein